jgi:hypothetical protein
MTAAKDILDQLDKDKLDSPTTYRMLKLMADQLDVVATNQRIVLDVLNGDPNRDLPGLRVRMKEVEATSDEWKRYKLIVKGVAVGMTLTMITSISTLITLISQTVKVLP